MQSDRQYLNVLVFAIISGIVSVVIMVLMLSLGAKHETIRELTPLIVTIEIGLLFIISLAIYKSVKYLMRLNSARDNHLNTRLQVTTCPDYWTLTSHDNQGKRVCTNTFKDPLDKNVTYTIIGTHPSSKAIRTVRLSDYNDRTIREACQKSQKEVKAPWHAIDSMC